MRIRHALALACAVAVATLGACVRPRSDHATSHRRFDDVAYWQRVFDDPARDAWQRPADVVAAARVAPGDAVADLGAGTGYFMPHLARAVGETGTVYAVETEPALVAHLKERAAKDGLARVVPVLASSSDPGLAPASIDVLLIVDTYHHIDDRVAYFRAARRLLRPGGRVVVVDWYERPLPVGPPPDHKLARVQVEREMARAGYRRAAVSEALPYQYVVVFEPVTAEGTRRSRPG